MLQDTKFRWILYYCVSSFIIESIGDLLAFLSITNIAFFYLFIWNSTFAILGFFIQQSNTIRKLLTFRVLLIIVIHFTLIFILCEDINKFHPFSAVTEGIIIFLCCLIYYGDELNEPKIDKILNKPEFWIVSGFFIYYGVLWIILLAAHYFVQNPSTFKFIWDGQNILNILKNIAIAIGLYKYRWN